MYLAVRKNLGHVKDSRSYRCCRRLVVAIAIIIAGGLVTMLNSSVASMIAYQYEPPGQRTSRGNVTADASGVIYSNETIEDNPHPPDVTFAPTTSVHGLNKRGKRKLEMLGRHDLLDPNRNCTKRLPTAIIIGVMKAGTEAFSTFLTMHPQVAMQVNMKTTEYFSAKYIKGKKWFRSKMMCSTKDQVTMEKAPQYFISRAPERIKSLNPDMKLILLVRDPVARAVSHYLQVKDANPQKLHGNHTFEEMVFTSTGIIKEYSNFIDVSKYSVHFKKWLKYFKKRQFLIIDGDEFKQDQVGSLSEAEDFLGINSFITRDRFVYNEAKGFYCLKLASGEDGCLSDGKGREHPNLSPDHVSKLRKYFQPYNEEFYRMVGRKFNW